MASNYKSFDDFLTKTQQIGSLKAAVTNNLYGLNHLGTPYLPSNRTQPGYVFLTRPQLNMQTYNLRGDRKFTAFLTSKDPSMFSWMRHTLDPRLQGGKERLTSKLVDPLQAFIPIVTNSVKNLSGWESPVLDTFSTDPSRLKGVYSIPDGVYQVQKNFTLDLTFLNIQGNPIVGLFDNWVSYMFLSKLNRLSKYPDYIVGNVRDFDTRVYRILLEPSGKKVAAFSMTGASFPVNSDIAKMFDHDKSKPFIDQSGDTTIRLECMGAYYNDPLVIRSFNEVVSVFNPEMRKINAGEASDYVRITYENSIIKNNTAYPRINPENLDMEWWTPN